MKRRNVTLSIPEQVLNDVRVFAAKRNKSISAILVETLRKILDEQDIEELRRRRFLARLADPPGHSGGEKLPTRDEIYEHLIHER